MRSANDQISRPRCCTTGTPRRTRCRSSLPRPVRPPGTAGDKAVTGFSHTVLIIWSILVILPLIWVLMSSFKTSSEIFASPFACRRSGASTTTSTPGRRPESGFFFNSVIVVVGALILTMTFGSMSAYVLASSVFLATGRCTT